jgi:HEPN domain-containing protein
MQPEQLHMVRLWIEKAEHDLRTAEHTLTLETDCPFDTICFYVQQAAEKYLKALLIFHSVEFPKTHDLLELFNLIPKSVKLNVQLNGLAAINRYAVESRYPGDWESFSRTEAEDALAVANMVRGAVKSALPKSIFTK